MTDAFENARKRLDGYDLERRELQSLGLDQGFLAHIVGRVKSKLYDQREVVATAWFSYDAIKSVRTEERSIVGLTLAIQRAWIVELEKACERVLAGLPRSNHLRWRGRR